ncbi:hypothetical protein B484DRAFT_459418 [Ochromonadaceae sp. CCMP2298]|nr:hypothetical protein B484DRAFT_459418 [Ochromonadaceae sp. CCMP2298]
MSIKIPRSIRMLSAYGADALRPSLFKGRYIAPLVSRRIAADLRKRAIIEGTFGDFVANLGGWDPAWDIPHKMFILKAERGHKRERTREVRAQKVTTAMEGMPDRIAKHDAEVEARKPKKDIFHMFKRAQLNPLKSN